ncbi:phosphopantetheine-binding protein [Paenibacillus sp. FSL R7-0204]|uniref:acyl carrier protein n=1 Tax=unclassified Paenibacillus TaxID=185978 RepID=UPI0030FA901E
MDNTRGRIKTIINEVLENPKEANIVNVLSANGLNSITFIKAIVSIEEEFNFEFPDEFLSLEKIPTVDALVQFIESYSDCNTASGH